MRQQGKLTEWDDKKGYGFITPSPEGARVFVHITAFPRGRRPRRDEKLAYETTRDTRGRLQAVKVRFANGTVGSQRAGQLFFSVVIAAGFLFLLVRLDELTATPHWLAALYAMASGLLFLLYGLDKWAARKGQWRIAESTLHLFGLAGGWPGALVARHLFRHKTKKQPFRLIFWVSATVNCSVLAMVLFREELTPLLADMGLV